MFSLNNDVISEAILTNGSGHLILSVIAEEWKRNIEKGEVPKPIPFIRNCGVHLKHLMQDVVRFNAKIKNGDASTFGENWEAEYPEERGNLSQVAQSLAKLFSPWPSRTVQPLSLNKHFYVLTNTPITPEEQRMSQKELQNNVALPPGEVLYSARYSDQEVDFLALHGDLFRACVLRTEKLGVMLRPVHLAWVSDQGLVRYWNFGVVETAPKHVHVERMGFLLEWDYHSP